MKKVAQLSRQERKELFSETANQMSITPAAAEKDFWICWVLLQLFENEELSRYLRFKGGTSLSKCYNIIERFSEDIDLILDWTPFTGEDPTASRSKTKQGKLNQNINEQAQAKVSVPTIVVERTFWEKLTILHAEAHRPADKALPSRYARHYYDVYKLVESGVHVKALKDLKLLEDVVVFKQRFYPSGWTNYDTATLAELVLQPSTHHIDMLAMDYGQMQEMLFGSKPSFDDMIGTLINLENKIHSLADKR